MRAARALLGITARQLAEATSLGLATIKRAEIHEEETSMTRANAERVIAAFETLGVEFIPENGGGAGVRFIRPRA